MQQVSVNRLTSTAGIAYLNPGGVREGRNITNCLDPSREGDNEVIIGNCIPPRASQPFNPDHSGYGHNQYLENQVRYSEGFREDNMTNGDSRRKRYISLGAFELQGSTGHDSDNAEWRNHLSF